jgi:hypothetical protein
MHLSKKLIVAVIAVAAIAAGTTAFAAIPDAGGVIHACYDSKTGALRLLDTPTNGFSLSCAPKEAGLTWNQQGPKGDKGNKGDKGDPGPSDGYAVLTAQPLDPVVTLTVGSSKVVATLNLPAGKYLVSAKAWLRSDDAIGSNNTCKLNLPNGGFDFQDAETRGGVGIYDAPVSLARPYETASAAQVNLTCWTDLTGVVV